MLLGVLLLLLLVVLLVVLLLLRRLLRIPCGRVIARWLWLPEVLVLRVCSHGHGLVALEERESVRMRCDSVWFRCGRSRRGRRGRETTTMTTTADCDSCRQWPRRSRQLSRFVVSRIAGRRGGGRLLRDYGGDGQAGLSRSRRRRGGRNTELPLGSAPLAHGVAEKLRESPRGLGIANWVEGGRGRRSRPTGHVLVPCRARSFAR